MQKLNNSDVLSLIIFDMFKLFFKYQTHFAFRKSASVFDKYMLYFLKNLNLLKIMELKEYNE